MLRKRSTHLTRYQSTPSSCYDNCAGEPLPSLNVISLSGGKSRADALVANR